MPRSRSTQNQPRMEKSMAGENASGGIGWIEAGRGEVGTGHGRRGVQTENTLRHFYDEATTTGGRGKRRLGIGHRVAPGYKCVGGQAIAKGEYPGIDLTQEGAGSNQVLRLCLGASVRTEPLHTCPPGQDVEAVDVIGAGAGKQPVRSSSGSAKGGLEIRKGGRPEFHSRTGTLVGDKPFACRQAS